LYADIDLLMPEVVVRRAISTNPPAAWLAVHDDTGGVSRTRLDRLIHVDAQAFASRGVAGTNETTLWDQQAAMARDRARLLAEHAESYGANTLDLALQLQGFDHPWATALYVEAVRSTAAGGTTYAARRVMGTHLVDFLPDLARDAWDQVPNAENLNRQIEPRQPSRYELIRFFGELGADRDATQAMGVSMRLWIEKATTHVASMSPDKQAWGRQVQEVSLMSDVARRGLERANAGKEKAATDFAAGVESWSVLAISAGLEVPTGFVSGPLTPAVSAFNYWVATVGAAAIGDRVRSGKVADARRGTTSPYEVYMNLSVQLQGAMERRIESKETVAALMHEWKAPRYNEEAMSDTADWRGHEPDRGDG
jgi:hypothetical protein